MVVHYISNDISVKKSMWSFDSNREVNDKNPG